MCAHTAPAFNWLIWKDVQYQKLMQLLTDGKQLFIDYKENFI